MRKYKLGNFKKSNNLFLSNYGFTLIEVLIAIVLLAFVSLYTFKMISTSTDTKENVLKEDQTIIQTLTAVARLDSDFSQLYSPLFFSSKSSPNLGNNSAYQDNVVPNGQYDGKNKNGLVVPQFLSPDKSTLIFYTSSNRRKVADTKESRYMWVKYSLRPEETDKNSNDNSKKTQSTYQLVRQVIGTNIYSSDLNWNDVKPQVLMDSVKSLEFSFWDERAKKYQSSLQDLNENKNAVRALKMSLIWVDENDHEQIIEKTYRIIQPYYNSKLDDLKMNNSYGGGTPPPGIPDPSNPQLPNDSQGGGGVH